MINIMPAPDVSFASFMVSSSFLSAALQTIGLMIAGRACDTDCSTASEADSAFRSGRSEARSFVPLWSRPPGVVAALDVCMILVARDQHERVDVAVGERSDGGNFSAVVDINRLVQLKTRVGRDQGV